MDTPIVQLQQFIQAIRDAGYRGTGSAVAELVDNSFEANAKRVDIHLCPDPEDASARAIVVSDDGHGMTPAILKLALQFGGSSRFGRRTGTGRFGMGLPNSSVSQARRLEVYSWNKPGNIWWSYLDVDEIQAGTMKSVPAPIRRKLPREFPQRLANHGTAVVWRRCDRLSAKRESTLINRLKRELGRTFRHKLWDGRELRINSEPVPPMDPLFLRAGNNLKGASMYGEVLEYTIRDEHDTERPLSKVTVRFVQLPVRQWVSLSNAEKRQRGISKGAGVSVLRAGREIDFGWFFMGKKRKENYDDWWRCEIDFPPRFDELFGVTHTKQGINPTEQITQLLTPDFEGIAHQLNAHVRSAFLKVKSGKESVSERRATECDKFFEPPKCLLPATSSKGREWKAIGPGGLKFKLTAESTSLHEFYSPNVEATELRVVLNRQHPFWQQFYQPLGDGGRCDSRPVLKRLELLIFAAARAELATNSTHARTVIAEFRRSWSDLLAAYLA